MLSALVLEEAGAHHGRGGKRNEQRNAYRHAEDYGKFAEEAADDAAHHQDGNEDGHERSAHGENGEANFAGAFHGGGKGIHAIFNVAGNVFDDHDGIIHDETGADGERHEGKIVEAVMAKVHHAESANQRKWHGHAGDDRGPNVSQEREDHENDEDDGNDQRYFDVVDGRANRGGAVNGNVQMQGRRDGCAEHWQDVHDPVDGFNHVGAGLAEDSHEDTRFSLGEAEVAGVFDGINDLGDVAQAHRSALMARDDQRLVFVGLEELIRGSDRPYLP